MNYQLVPPSAAYVRSYAAYIRELGDEERYPFPLDYDHDDFRALLRRLDNLARGIDVPEGFVPSSTFWLVDGDELVGVSNLRHELNDRIREIGGHIGLGIRPTYRGRGLGNRLLGLTIAEARRRGITPIHIHCHKHNAASARMIASNGGVLESEVAEPGSTEIVQRWLISPMVAAPP
ncbi:MAG: GNAT family N-acetyltransferase [Steroidobacteraceae bacterium]